MDANQYVANSRISQARILVLESDDLALAALEHSFLRLGIEDRHVCEQPVEALRQWRRVQPDVSLIDVQSADGEGFKLARDIRQIDPDAAIIMFSCEASCHDLQQALEIGVEGYLFKPLDFQLLRETLERALEKRERLMDLRMGRMVFEVANEGIIVTDDEPRILAVNPAFTEITGYRPDEVVGRKPSMLSAGYSTSSFYRSIWETLKTRGRWSGEIVNRRRDGEQFSEWLSIAAVDGDLHGSRRYVGLVSDITERKQEEERMRQLAHFDCLTGLANRVLFSEQLHRTLARAERYGESIALVYIDLDYFKDINDNYGHAVGDEVLQVLAARMQDMLRKSDTVSRRGGDEFVILLELDGHPEGLAAICAKLIAELSRPIELDEYILQPSASLGIAVYPTDARTESELLAAADTALYEAKAAGRRQFRIFRSDAQLQADTRLDMEKELRAGLKDWRYSLRYLPEICLHTGEVENVEALLRFHHPEHGLLDAGRFLEVAEQIGIMPELGRRALAEAVKEILSLDNTREIGLVVDLSTRQLAAPGALNNLLEVLREAGVPNRLITFECPETALGGNQLALETLFGLALSGCRFTLDDFGSGYCSFGLLRQLPMSSIKIDRCFISEVTSSAQMRDLVAALIAFAKRLGLRVVAEGVETAAQLSFLKEVGCDAAQGYVFGRPMPLNELREMLAVQAWLPKLGISAART